MATKHKTINRETIRKPSDGVKQFITLVAYFHSTIKLAKRGHVHRELYFYLIYSNTMLNIL